MDYQTEIFRAADIIAAGGIVAIPTDTLFGLAADALNSDAVERVYVAKGRPADMPLPVLVSGWEQATQVAAIPADALPMVQKLAEAYWPGNLTMVLSAAPGLPERLTAGHDTIAVRMPNHPAPLALAEALGRPITGTSANRSGEPDIADADELRTIIGPRVDGIIASGPTPKGTASTIISVSPEGTALLREGALPYREILDLLGMMEARS